jgi:RNA polymerase sigma factor (TIGR02999 family)
VERKIHFGQWHLRALENRVPVFCKRAFKVIGYNRAMSDVTRILSAIERGDENASAKLLPLVYQELRKLAAAKLSKEKPGETLQPTMLVHEAYLRLVDVDKPQEWNGRGHFFGAAAEAMRRILVENARRKQALKHGGALNRVELQDGDGVVDESSMDLIALDEALARFQDEDPHKAQLVKLRYFGGLTLEQAAATMKISRATASRHWAYARAWLRVELDGGKDPPAAKKTSE